MSEKQEYNPIAAPEVSSTEKEVDVNSVQETPADAILFADEERIQNKEIILDIYFDPKKEFGRNFPYSHTDLVSVSGNYAKKILEGSSDIVVEHTQLSYGIVNQSYAARINKKWWKSRSPIDNEIFKNLDRNPKYGLLAYGIPYSDVPPIVGYLIEPIHKKGRNAPDNFKVATNRYGTDKLVKKEEGGRTEILPAGLFFSVKDLPKDIKLEGISNDEPGDFHYRVQPVYNSNVVSLLNTNKLRWSRNQEG